MSGFDLSAIITIDTEADVCGPDGCAPAGQALPEPTGSGSDDQAGEPEGADLSRVTSWTRKTL